MGQNYFNTLPLRLQLEELAKCRFMGRSEFAAGVDVLVAERGAAEHSERAATEAAASVRARSRLRVGMPPAGSEKAAASPRAGGT